MPPEREITLRQAEQIRDALMPAFTEALGDKIDELEGRLEQKYDLRFAAIEKRVTAQEGFGGRVKLVYGVISAIAIIIWGLLSDWVRERVSHKP